jgi:putative transposase
LNIYAVLSDGSQSETQAYYRRDEDRLKKLQRGLARKKKGSKNRAKWKRKVGRAHARVANLRRDHMHKFTRQVADRFEIVCVEDLCLKGLTQTRLGKSFHDAGIGRMMKTLEYKIEDKGGYFQAVDRFFPSTKRCHMCGYINNDLTLADREWTCPQCGARHQRDLNSAINLEMEGVRLLAGSGFIGVTTVELAASTLKPASMQVAGCETVRK